MLNIRKMFIFLIATFAIVCCNAKELVLAENDKTDYVIVAEESVQKSAAGRELTRFLKEMTGVDFTFGSAKSKRIFLGDSPALREVLSVSVLEGLKDQEALVMTKGNDLILVGGGKLGNIYAVYEFLENQGGCRWYSAYGAKNIPKKKRFAIDSLNYRNSQAFTNRFMTLVYMFKHPKAKSFLYRNRLNMENHNFKRTGFEPQIKLQGPQAHTLLFYIPPKKTYNPWGWKWKNQKSYFKTNPEFFSLALNGKRTDRLQLCFSNPELRKELTRRLEERIQSFNGKGVFNISAMDVPRKFCYCNACRQLEKNLQCSGAPLFDYLIEAAKIIKIKYPEAKLSTLVYRKEQSEKPPTLSEPIPDNLIFIFAPIDSDLSKPLDHANNAGTLANLKGWTALSNNVWVWYYTLPYGDTLPYGGIKRMAADIKILADIGCAGTYFEHDVGVFEGYNFSDLMTWVMLKLYQNPNQDYKKLVSEFCDRYYKAASADFQKYLYELEAYRERFKSKLRWNGTALSMGYSIKDINSWEGLFTRMEKAVADDPKALLNVQDARVKLDILLLQNWKEFTKEFKDTKYTTEFLRKRILKYGKSAITRRSRNRKQTRIRLASLKNNLRNVMLRATCVPKLLPAPLDKIEKERIRQAIPVRVHGCGYQKMSDAAFGVAIREEKRTLELPFTFGFYDEENKKFIIHHEKIEKKDIIIDKFHLYKLGTAALTAKCLVWLTGSWRASIQLGEFMEMGNPFQKWDIYVSLKFEGPGYSSSSKAKANNVWCDRVVLIKHLK